MYSSVQTQITHGGFMKFMLLTLTVLMSATAAMADTHICNFRVSNVAHSVRFDFTEIGNRKDVLVTIKKENRIMISHTAKIKVDGDSHGDGWGMTLSDSLHRQYKYDLSFDAADLYNVRMSLPGVSEVETQDCRRIRR